MNTKNIQPKRLWTSNGEKEAVMLALTNFTDYHFDEGGGVVVYKLIGIKDEGENHKSAEDLFIGSLPIPSFIISQWGESDQIIWDYVTNQLNIQLV
jgi:hypothetical protein